MAQEKKSVIKQLDSKSSIKWGFEEFVKENESKKTITFTYSSNKKKKITFTNFLPISRFKKIANYERIKSNYGCGLNAINMALLFFDYKRLMKLSEYSYMYPLIDTEKARFGMFGESMYDCNIKPWFEYCGCSCDTRAILTSPSLNTSYIYDNKYDQYVIMFVTGVREHGHYLMVIGVSDDKNWYFVTDHSKCVWLIKYDQLKDMLYYRSNTGWSLVDTRSYYKMG